MSAGIDWRQSPGYTRRGGLYEVAIHDYQSDQGGAYGFQKSKETSSSMSRSLRESWVCCAARNVETTLNDNDLVPYFLLPQLGSGSTLGGIPATGSGIVTVYVMKAEFRWTPSVALDMALFYDAGKVTSRRNDLDFKGLKSDVGVAFVSRP